VFRSIVLAFAALLVMGQARDKSGVVEPAAERDRNKPRDQWTSAPDTWTSRPATRRTPVSEL
jgi:hypothetical protein